MAKAARGSKAKRAPAARTRAKVAKRAAALARGNVPGAGKKRPARGRGIPLVGRLVSPGAPGSGIAGAAAVEPRARKDRRR